MRLTGARKRTTRGEAEAKGNGILLFIVNTDLYFILPYFQCLKSKLLSLYLKITGISKEKMKCTPMHVLDKKEINQIRMAIYRKEKITDSQKQKSKSRIRSILLSTVLKRK